MHIKHTHTSSYTDSEASNSMLPGRTTLRVPMQLLRATVDGVQCRAGPREVSSRRLRRTATTVAGVYKQIK